MKGIVISIENLNTEFFAVKVTQNEEAFELLKNKTPNNIKTFMDSIKDFTSYCFGSGKNIDVSFVENKSGTEILSIGFPSGLSNEDKRIIHEVAFRAASGEAGFYWEDLESFYDENSENEEELFFFKLPYFSMIFDIPFAHGSVIEKNGAYFIISNNLGLCDYLDITDPVYDYAEVTTAERIVNRLKERRYGKRTSC